jgi:hypothetical protein
MDGESAAARDLMQSAAFEKRIRHKPGGPSHRFEEFDERR